MRLPDAIVDCGKCCACCKSHEVIALMGADNPDLYEHKVKLPRSISDQLDVMQPDHQGFMLARGKDGACAYLNGGRCSIWPQRPYVCRTFSCIGFVRKMKAEANRVEIRRAMRDGVIDKDVWRAGVERGG